MNTAEMGAAGARRAAALLGIAACAETTHATMSEEGAKVDLKISFRHAFEPTRLLSIQAQVKSGKSYCANASHKDLLKLKIDADTKKALFNGYSPGLLLWVPPRPMDRIFWYAGDPRRPNTSRRISREQYIRPSIRYDLTRLAAYSAWKQTPPRQTFRSLSEDAVLGVAKEAYSELKRAEIRHPLVGELIVSRLGWRHVTRRSKPSRHRILNLRAVPYLRALLNRSPDRFACNFRTPVVRGPSTIDSRDLVCWYNRVFDFEEKRYTLLLRIKEEIAYPTKWMSRPIAVGDITQTATLASWWAKEST